ncbi:MULTISPECIES: FecCD family ABC transporter permease [Nocardioides]|uniref:FecCD family ABC transporter permease n=1 Tax=Nocardioides vastitatis TaxID=2568655 RepID=A0ABW0ZNJ0_9ACTN|nr:iron ABC transporter permease [Nocardioides sp.]THI96601.1 iron ABC transporter permease [Nocardioides sp.]
MSTTTATQPVARRSTRPLARLVAPLLLAGLVVALGIFGLVNGTRQIPVIDALAATVGLADGGTSFIVQQLRLPRVVVAIAAGACLGASGMLMQGLLRNPLASPDIIGVTGGASLTAVLAIGAGLPPLALPFAAAFGAASAAGVLYVFSRWTGASSVRLILVGIGVHAVTNAAVTLVVARIDPGRLGAAEVWLSGSLHARNTTHVTVVLVGAALALPLAYALLRSLATLELGDEIATGAGVPVRRTRTLLVVTSALLAGVAVAVAGPLGFVALGAPHIARRLVGPTSPATLTTSMLTGALLVLAADALGQRLLDDAALPAGVITAALGAPYLLWLLHRTGRP